MTYNKTQQYRMDDGGRQLELNWFISYTGVQKARKNMHVGAKQGYFVNDNTSFLKENTCKIYVIKPRQPPDLKTHLIGKEEVHPA